MAAAGIQRRTAWPEMESGTPSLAGALRTQIFLSRTPEKALSGGLSRGLGDVRVNISSWS